jgi:hypothetical protein
LTVGLLRPHILLPMVSRQWDEKKLEAVLIHESEHVRRRDPFVEWLALMNRSIYWFHPLSWWLCRKMAMLAEESCDEAVIARGHDRSAYAELLLDLSRSVRQKGRLVTVWGSSIRGSALAKRIHKILNSDISPSISRTRLFCLMVVCGAVEIVPAAGELSHVQTVAATLPGEKMPILELVLPESETEQSTISQSDVSTSESDVTASESDFENITETGLLKRGMESLEETIIERIEIRGNRRIPEERIRFYIQSYPGDDFDEERLEFDIRALWKSSFFQDIQVHVMDGNIGKIVTFVVEEKPLIRSIEYVGLKSFNESDIEEAYKENKIGLSIDSRYGPEKIKRAERVIKDLLIQHGKSQGTVRTEIEEMPPSGVRIRMILEEDPK